MIVAKLKNTGFLMSSPNYLQFKGLFGHLKEDFGSIFAPLFQSNDINQIYFWH
jgi:hypothetical protein